MCDDEIAELYKLGKGAFMPLISIYARLGDNEVRWYIVLCNSNYRLNNN